MAYVVRAESMEMIEGTASKLKEETQISINSSKTYRRNTQKTDGFEEVPVVDKEFQSFSVLLSCSKDRNLGLSMSDTP